MGVGAGESPRLPRGEGGGVVVDEGHRLTHLPLHGPVGEVLGRGELGCDLAEGQLRGAGGRTLVGEDVEGEVPGLSESTGAGDLRSGEHSTGGADLGEHCGQAARAVPCGCRRGFR